MFCYEIYPEGNCFDPRKPVADLLPPGICYAARNRIWFKYRWWRVCSRPSYGFSAPSIGEVVQQNFAVNCPMRQAEWGIRINRVLAISFKFNEPGNWSWGEGGCKSRVKPIEICGIRNALDTLVYRITWSQVLWVFWVWKLVKYLPAVTR